MNTLYKLNQVPDEYEKKSYDNLIVFPTINSGESEEIIQDGDYINQQGRIPVQPIVGDDLQRVKDYILNRPVSKKHKGIDFNLRDYTILCFNFNMGLRVGDLLHLKISDVLVNGKIVDYICIHEQKTRKTKTKNVNKKSKPAREILILPEVQEIIMRYINSMNVPQTICLDKKDKTSKTFVNGWSSDWYLFHGIWPYPTPYDAMSRENMWYKMDKIEKELEFAVPLGTHSMRKSYARALYDRLSQTDPMAIIVIQEMLGHSSPEITLRYIGITREKRNDLRVQAGLI